MKTQFNPKSAFVSLRITIGFVLGSLGLVIGLAGISESVNGTSAVKGALKPVPLLNQNAVANAVPEDDEADAVYYGACEATYTGGRWRTNGYCVTHRPPYNICVTQPSADCPNGRRVHELGSTPCGLDSVEIDLMRPCSF